MKTGGWDRVVAARALVSQLRAARANLVVEVCLTAASDFPEGAELEAALSDHLAALGAAVHPLQATKVGPVLQLRGTVKGTFGEEPQLNTLFFCRPQVDLSLFDSNAKRDVLKASAGGESARGIGRDRDTAAKAAIKQLSKACEQKLSEVFGD